MHSRGFIRMKAEVNVGEPFLSGFWWTNVKGNDKWATIKFERLSDFCYGCGKLGHTSLTYNEEIAISENDQTTPMY